MSYGEYFVVLLLWKAFRLLNCNAGYSFLLLSGLGSVSADGKNLVKLIDPPPPERPKDPFAGRGTRNRKPKVRHFVLDPEDLIEDEEASFAIDGSNTITGWRESSDEESLATLRSEKLK